MELLELMRERYSVREFEDKKIEQEELDKILEAGRIAPTACNYQPQRILVLQEKESIEKLKECTKYTFDAPVILLICVEKEKGWVRRYDNKNHAEIDAAVVTTQMMLEAYSLGIGSTWVCSFNPEKVKENFNIPETYEIVNILPMGYPKAGNKPSLMHAERLDLSETVFYGEYK